MEYIGCFIADGVTGEVVRELLLAQILIQGNWQSNKPIGDQSADQITEILVQGRLIYKTYIGETHYKSWLDFSQHASISCHHPLCAMSPSTIRHVIIHQITYLCLKSIFCGL
jgi:hypothetical protein